MPTRADADAKLAQPVRAGKALAEAGINTTATGSPPRVAAFDDALAVALAACGVAPADPTTPTDADLALLPAAKWPMLLDVAELLLLESAAAALAASYNRTQLPDVTRERDLAALGRAVERKRQSVLVLYGWGGPTLTPGVVWVRTRPAHPEF